MKTETIYQLLVPMMTDCGTIVPMLHGPFAGPSGRRQLLAKARRITSVLTAQLCYELRIQHGVVADVIALGSEQLQKREVTMRDRAAWLTARRNGIGGRDRKSVV